MHLMLHLMQVLCHCVTGKLARSWTCCEAAAVYVNSRQPRPAYLGARRRRQILLGAFGPTPLRASNTVAMLTVCHLCK